MNVFVKFIGSAVVAATVIVAGSVMGSTQAHAVPFGAATAGIVGLVGVPFLSVTSTTIDMTGSTPFLIDSTDQLSGADGVDDSSTGVVYYSTTVGDTIANVAFGLFAFSDGSGGHYVFDLDSATTLSYDSGSGTTAIGLYMLGSMYDTSADLTPTATSITFTISNNDDGDFTWSASLTNPVPEPVSLLILGTGIAGLGLARRGKAA